MVLAPVSWLFDRAPLKSLADETTLVNGTTVYTHVREHRYAMALLGTLLVLLIGLLGRAVGGTTVGLVSAAIAALYPHLWVSDGLIMSETVTGIAVVTALLFALQVARRPSWGSAIGLGVATGFATLGRAELVLFAPLLVIPAAWFGARQVASALRYVAVAGVAMVVVIGPWVAYNLARFDDRTFVSTNDGIALAGSNCDPVYSGGGIGLTVLAPPCIDSPHPPGDESVIATVYRKRAFDYMRDHKRDVPKVVAARIGRTWSVFRPMDMLEFNRGEGRERWVTALGLYTFLPLLALAIAGGFVLARRDGKALWVLVVPAIVSTIGVAATYGQTRFRAAAEPSIVVLAALAGVAIWRLLRARGAAPAGIA
jgi:4-amino-4-deoxy-L-arabinose transferase-like glycosyltransferase